MVPAWSRSPEAVNLLGLNEGSARWKSRGSPLWRHGVRTAVARGLHAASRSPDSMSDARDAFNKLRQFDWLGHYSTFLAKRRVMSFGPLRGSCSCWRPGGSTLASEGQLLRRLGGWQKQCGECTLAHVRCSTQPNSGTRKRWELGVHST